MSREYPDADWRGFDQVVDLYRRSFEAFEADRVLSNELGKLICVRLVALIQAAVRWTISDVVDAKESRGEPIPELKDIKLTVAMARELKNQSFTFGELISHFLPVSSPEQISSSLAHVTGFGFIDAIKTHLSEKPIEDEPWRTREQLIAYINDSLAELFQHRNVLCHEDVPDHIVDVQKTKHYLYATTRIIASLLGFRFDATFGFEDDEKKPLGHSKAIGAACSQATDDTSPS